jgi:hypothetical protein
MNLNDNKKGLVIAFITIAVLIVGVVGASYAYFAAQIGGASNTVINVSSGTVDSCAATAGNTITFTATQANFGSGSGNQSGTSSNPKVTLTANSNATAKCCYSAQLVITTNTFTKTGSNNDLTITISDGSSNLFNNVPVTGVTGVYNIPTSSTSTLPTSAGTTFTNELAAAAPQHSFTASAGGTANKVWSATLTFNNLDVNQNNNINKSFVGYLRLTPTKTTTSSGTC